MDGGKSLGPAQWEWIATARLVARRRASVGAVEELLDGLLSGADQAMVNAFTTGFRVTQVQNAIATRAEGPKDYGQPAGSDADPDPESGTSGADEGISPLSPQPYEPEPEGPTTSTEDKA